MGTATRTPTGGTGPTFKEIIDDNAPYIGAMYLLNIALFAMFVDLGALLQGRLEYASLFSGGEGVLVTKVAAAAFAIGFVFATVVALSYAISVLLAQENDDVDPYSLEERISTITVMPAVQLFAVVLCPVLTGHNLAEGVMYLPEVVGLLV